MQFKHPEILYALLLLLIPIIVHLFQLRRFQKVDFTNVAFLKKATLQTRRSSTIKKWLTLLARLLAMACIILAFAQPFTATKTALNTEKETVIYLDNSFSMEAKSANGPLLTQAQQQLYDQLDGDKSISWFTNTTTKTQVSQSDFKNEVLRIKPSSKSLNPTNVWLKAQQLFSNSPSADKRFIWISDFQQNQALPDISGSDIQVDVIQQKPVNPFNLSIDSCYIVSKKVNSLQLGVDVSGTGEIPENTAVSLYNSNQLIAKTAVQFDQSQKGSIQFDIENPDTFVGTIQVNDTQLPYDNRLYFSLNPQSPIKVLAINQASGDYLRKLFNSTAYAFESQAYDEINYSDLTSQNFIVLNQLDEIPVSLVNALKSFHEAGGSLFIAPSVNSDIQSYNTLLNALQLGSFGQLITGERKITQINFSHPLYERVFEKEVTNFQYPMVQSLFSLQSNAPKILTMEDGRPFLVGRTKIYLATAALESENSNFTNSPLIVPTLLNMAQQSLPLPELYYRLNESNTFALPISLGTDQIIRLQDSIHSIIPLQQTKAQSVSVTVTDELEDAGNYQVYLEDTPLLGVSFNYARTESSMRTADLSDWGGIQQYDSVHDLFESIADANEMNFLWKWFVIFAVLFLLFELFILKFL